MLRPRPGGRPQDQRRSHPSAPVASAIRPHLCQPSSAVQHMQQGQRKSRPHRLALPPAEPARTARPCHTALPGLPDAHAAPIRRARGLLGLLAFPRLPRHPSRATPGAAAAGEQASPRGSRGPRRRSDRPKIAKARNRRRGNRLIKLRRPSPVMRRRQLRTTNDIGDRQRFPFAVKPPVASINGGHKTVRASKRSIPRKRQTAFRGKAKTPCFSTARARGLSAARPVLANRH